MDRQLTYDDVLAAFDDVDRQAGRTCAEQLDDTMLEMFTRAVLTVEGTGQRDAPACQLLGVADGGTVSRVLSIPPSQLAGRLGLSGEDVDLFVDAAGQGHDTAAYAPVTLATFAGDPHQALAGQHCPPWVGAAALIAPVRLHADGVLHGALASAGVPLDGDGTIAATMLTTMTRTGLVCRGVEADGQLHVTVLPAGTSGGPDGTTVMLLARLLGIGAPVPTRRPWLHLAEMWARWVLDHTDGWVDRHGRDAAGWRALAHRPDWLAAHMGPGAGPADLQALTGPERDGQLLVATGRHGRLLVDGGWPLVGQVAEVGAPTWVGRHAPAAGWLDGPSALVALGLTGDDLDAGFALDLLAVDDEMPQWFCDDVVTFRRVLDGLDDLGWSGP